MPVPSVDTARLLEYRVKGLSYEDIGKLTGLVPSGIHARIANIEALMDTAKDGAVFAERRTQILQGLQAGLLARAAECLSEENRGKVSMYQAVGSFGLLYDKERLETNKSTGNVSILTQIVNSSEETGDKALRKLGIEAPKVKIINPD